MQAHTTHLTHASITITTPTPQATVGHTFIVHVMVRGYTLRARHNPRGGVLHFALDNGRYDQPGHSSAGHAALVLGVNGYYSPTTTTSITYRHIPPGTHHLTVTLATASNAATNISRSETFIVQ